MPCFKLHEDAFAAAAFTARKVAKAVGAVPENLD